MGECTRMQRPGGVYDRTEARYTPPGERAFCHVMLRLHVSGV